MYDTPGIYSAIDDKEIIIMHKSLEENSDFIHNGCTSDTSLAEIYYAIYIDLGIYCNTYVTTEKG